jgi:phosphoglycerate dehydrogenase-like enzyme
VSPAEADLRVAVLDDYQSVAATLADWAGTLPAAEIVFFPDHIADHGVLVDRLVPFDVIVAMRERTPFPRDVLERLPQLKLLISTGMRNNSIDLIAAANLGIIVCGTRGVEGGASELAWALILGLLRGVSSDDALIRRGGWQQALAGNLDGQVLGIIGLGRLGSRVARIGLAFGMKVIAWSPHLTPERAEAVGVDCVSKQDLFCTADVVSIHLALVEETRDLIGSAELKAMRPSSFLVNTSRAGLVNEVALRQALFEGWIAGVGLDVFAEEPLPSGHWLRSSPRTLLSPHMGFVTENNYRLYYTDALADIAAFLADNPVRVLK